MLHIFAARKPEVTEPLRWVWARSRDEAERQRADLAGKGELVSEIKHDIREGSNTFHLQRLI